jgi:hypothetical protein
MKVIKALQQKPVPRLFDCLQLTFIIYCFRLGDEGADTEQTNHKACCEDERLAQMIDEVSELLEPLKFCSDAERAIALAQ